MNVVDLLAALDPAVAALPDYVTQTVACGPFFYRDVAVGMSSVPVTYHRELHRAGVRVVLGDRLVNMEPALLAEYPRGFPAGRQELFAALFAMLAGGGPAPAEADPLLRLHFRRCRDAVWALFPELPPPQD